MGLSLPRGGQTVGGRRWVQRCRMHLAAAWTCTKALCSGPPAPRSGCASSRRNRTVVAGLGDEPKQSRKTLWRWRLRPAGGRGAEQAVFEVLEPESARHHRSGHERGQEQDGHDSHTRVRSRCRLIRQRLSEVPQDAAGSWDAELFWIC